jgi:dipeptidyl aminopeptidase/acylaminoacyl peptidase
MSGRRLVALLASLLIAAACSPSTDEPAPSVAPAASGSPSGALFPTPSVVTAPTGSPVATAGAPSRPLASSGSIALVRGDGSLWLTDFDGRTIRLAGAADGVHGFPTWSPDASQIAVIRADPTGQSIVVFDVDRASGLPLDPRVIFRSANVGPFYLSWTPDGRAVSFLADDGGGVALRIAPADGSAPLDGTGPGAVIRTGNPFYYDWIDSDHLLAHIGDGAEAFLGEIGLDGDPIGAAFEAPGPFRSVDVSSDGRYAGYVRAGTGGTDAIVLAAREGAAEQTMPVVGVAAVEFSPTDDTLASIGAVEPQDPPKGFPLGPLRLLDAVTGSTQTLLDGQVVSFSWSPDGKTIAAIRFVPFPGLVEASASPGASPTPAQDGLTEIRLAFVDVASGAIVSESRVTPGTRYIESLLNYFDQYALSHRLWAPDSSSILLPQVDPVQTTRLDVVFANGDRPVSLEGEIGFWSP